MLARLLVVVALALASGLEPASGRGAGSHPAALLLLAPPAALLVVPLTAALGLVDVARRGERALLANFGVSRRRVVAWFAMPAAVGELLLALLAALAIGLA